MPSWVSFKRWDQPKPSPAQISYCQAIINSGICDMQQFYSQKKKRADVSRVFFVKLGPGPAQNLGCPIVRFTDSWYDEPNLPQTDVRKSSLIIDMAPFIKLGSMDTNPETKQFGVSCYVLIKLSNPLISCSTSLGFQTLILAYAFFFFFENQVRCRYI